MGTCEIIWKMDLVGPTNAFVKVKLTKGHLKEKKGANDSVHIETKRTTTKKYPMTVTWQEEVLDFISVAWVGVAVQQDEGCQASPSLALRGAPRGRCAGVRGARYHHRRASRTCALFFNRGGMSRAEDILCPDSPQTLRGRYAIIRSPPRSACRAQTLAWS